jgi:MFS family permease
MRSLGRVIRKTPLLADLPREVAVLATIAFFVALGFGILIPSLPIFASTFGVNAFQAGMVISVFALVRFVTSPLSGSLVNRLGERIVLSSGLLIVALSSLVAGFSQSYLQLLLLRGSAMALLLRVTTSQQRGRASSAFQGGFLFGGVAGPAVGGLVVAWSIRAPFFVYAATLLVATAVSLVFLSRVRLHDREEQVSAGRASKREELRAALKDKAYQAALGSNLITGFVIFGLRSSIVPLFVVEGLQRGASLSGIGFLVAAAAQAIFLLPAGRMADLRGRRPALLFGTISSAFGMALLAFSDLATNILGTAGLAGVVLFLVAMAVQGFGGAFMGSAPAALVGDIMGGRKGGVVIATFQMMSDVGAIVGPLIAGVLVDAFDFDWAFAAGAALALIPIFLVFRMRETLVRTGAGS